MDLKRLPDKPGAYRIALDVSCLGHLIRMPLSLILPTDYNPAVKQPALVYLPDTDEPADIEGYRIAGPVKELSGQSPLAKWSPLVVIAPQCPPGQTWERFLLRQAAAGTIDQLLGQLPIDTERTYLTGSGKSATALWKLAPLLPGRFAVIVPFCTMEVRDGQLLKILDGTEVHIVTGVLNGMATDSANQMKEFLAPLHPAPDVVYEMQMGSEVAAHYYASQDFYQWLLAWRRPAGKIATR